MNEKKLTEKQKRFIDFYIEFGNATEAARRAGYKGNNLDRIGHENLRKLEEYIKPKIEAKDNERIASQDEVLEFLTRVIRGEELDQFGLDASLKDRLESAKMLGQRYGTFIQKIQQNVNAEVLEKQKNAIDDIVGQMHKEDDS